MAINVKVLLSRALIELSEEKPLSKITITDIVTRSGAGRQTFYNHFHDKNDLIYWIFLRTLRGEKKLIESEGFFAYLTNLYTEAQKNSKFLQQACKISGQNSLSEAIYLQTYNYYKNLVESVAGKVEDGTEMDFALRFNAYGATSQYIRWAENGMPGEARTQAQYALHCIPKCVKDCLPLSDKEKN